MHHFIFPSQDTYITDRPVGLDVKNFGVDEILQVGTTNAVLGVISDTKDYVYVNQYFQNYSAQDFTGIFTGSVSPGTASFSGSLVNVTACLTGTGSGVDVRNEKNRTYVTSQSIDRALLQFDLTAVSQSIVEDGIVSASFFLKVKICKEYQLPIDYSIYVAPISESWYVGNGYASDGGSDQGANWLYRDFDGGTPWSSSGASIYPVYCTQSFHYKSADIDMDVTPIVNLWLNGTVPNNGMVLISSDEFTANGSGFILKYFSEDTNTIYSPFLDVAWDDSVFVTGSFFTASSQISVVSASSIPVTSGSSLIEAGGVHGNFTASTYLNIETHYITASGDMTPFCNELVQQFTGSLTGSFYGIADVIYGEFSGSGNFYADYFSGSIDGVSIESTGSVNGNLIDVFISGTVIMPTASIFLFTGYFLSDAISLTGTGSGQYYDSASYAFDGFIMGDGISGNISGVPIIGPAFGVIGATTMVVTLPTEWHYSYATSPNESPYNNIIGQMFHCNSSPFGNGGCWDGQNIPIQGNVNYKYQSPFCRNTPYAFDDLYYVWKGDGVGWTTTLPILPPNVLTSSCGKFHVVQLMSGTFSGGVFSGSSFIAYYENYRIIFGVLTGSWNPEALYGETLTINFPALYDSYYSAYLSGEFIYGPLLGIFTTSGSYSASFVGQFTDGMTIGAIVDLQLSGSVYTSSFTYTSSVNFTSSLLYPLDTGRPFSINLGNVQPEYKAGDLIKLNVFARKKFPLKYFGISSQQEQYLVPEFLPSSSYWALKDNQTDEIVVNFDSYTRISCEYPDGNYFYVDTTSLPQERYYRVLIRVDDGEQIDTIDTGKTFKIVR